RTLSGGDSAARRGRRTNGAGRLRCGPDQLERPASGAAIRTRHPAARTRSRPRLSACACRSRTRHRRTPSVMTMTHRSIVRISFAAALVWTSGCSEPSVEKVETAAAVPVSVEVAKTDTIEGVISVTGTVTPAPGAEITIVAPEPARIAELPKAEGDAVAAGDLLVRFDIPSRPAEVAARRAEVAQATVRLTTARAAVTRLTGLVERGVASAREVEEAKREEADAQAALDQAQSAVTATEALAARSVVRATFAGAIAKRFHNVGDLVESSASDPILRVVDP